MNLKALINMSFWNVYGFLGITIKHIQSLIPWDFQESL